MRLTVATELVRSVVHEALLHRSAVFNGSNDKLVAEVCAIKKQLTTVSDMFHFMAQSIAAIVPDGHGATRVRSCILSIRGTVYELVVQ